MADAKIGILVEADNRASAGLGSAARQVDALGRAGDRTARSAGKSAGALGRLRSLGGAAARVLGPIGLALSAAEAGQALIRLGADSIRAGSDLQQSLGAAEAVFGTTAAAIKKAAEGAAQGVGVSRAEYLQFAAVLGAGLKNQGLKDYGDQTQKIIGLGADLAAQFGGSTKDAIAAIASLMRGEADPIERYGVSIKQSAINAELAARGQSKLTGAARTQAEAQARLALLFRQTASAQGTFAKESNTLAGQQQRLGAAFDDFKAKIGTALLPILTAAVSAVNGLFTGQGKLSAGLQQLGAIVGGFLSPVLSGLGSIWQQVSSTVVEGLGGVENMQRAWAVLAPILAQAGNVLGQIVGGAFRVVGFLLSKYVGLAISAAKATVNFIMQARALAQRIAATPTGQAIWSAIRAGVGAVVAIVRTGIAIFRTIGGAIGAVRAGIFTSLSGLLNQVVAAARPVAGPIEAIGRALANVGGGALRAVAGVIESIAGAATRAANAVQTLLNKISSASTGIGRLGSLPGLRRAAGGGLLAVPDIGRRIVVRNQIAAPVVIVDGAALRGVIRSELRGLVPTIPRVALP